MTEREIDISTGKPRSITDAEAADEIRTQHQDAWRDRDGETVRALILRSGFTALGKVWQRGEVLTCVVGSDDWIATLDPSTGESFLGLDAEAQVKRWGRPVLVVMHDAEPHVDTPDPFDDERPPRPMPLEVNLPKSEQMMYQRMRDVWAEQDRLAAEPYTTAYRYMEYPD